MTDVESNALVRRSPHEVGKIGTGAASIVSGIVSDALAIARSRGSHLAAARLRIGNYEFCDLDYRQILLWAEALKIDPTTVIQLLESASVRLDENETISLQIENGALVSLAWNFVSLPLSRFEWIEGLLIYELAFYGSLGAPLDHLTLHLPSLRILVVSCEENQITELDLSNVPEVTELSCYDNQLSELKLSNVPKLNTLVCYGNQLTEIDLRSNRKLKTWYCDPFVNIKRTAGANGKNE